MEVEEKEDEEWISVDGMDDAVNFNIQVKAVSAPGYPEENIDKLLDLGTCESPSSSATGDRSPKLIGRKCRRPSGVWQPPR